MQITKYKYNHRIQWFGIHTDLDLIEYFRMRDKHIDSNHDVHYNSSYRGGDIAYLIMNLCAWYGASLTFEQDQWAGITATGTASFNNVDVDFNISVECDDLPVGVLQIYDHLKSLEDRVLRGDMPDGLIECSNS